MVVICTVPHRELGPRFWQFLNFTNTAKGNETNERYVCENFYAENPVVLINSIKYLYFVYETYWL